MYRQKADNESSFQKKDINFLNTKKISPNVMGKGNAAQQIKGAIYRWYHGSMLSSALISSEEVMLLLLFLFLGKLAIRRWVRCAI
jgi:hypothetical protein